MKKFKKLLAILLVASMIFTTNAVNVFAEGMNANQEEQLNEETTVGANEESVGANVHGARLEDEENSTEVNDDEEVEEEVEEEIVDENEPEEEAEETTVGANACGAREEETETESELELELDKNKKDDQLYGDDPVPTAFVYYLTYNSSDKKYEKTHATIRSDADPFLDSANLIIEGIYNSTSVPAARLQNWYIMYPSDPTTADYDAYDHFNSGSTIGKSLEELRGVIMNWYNMGSSTENLHIGAGFDRCTFNYMYLNIGNFEKPEERSKTYGGTQEGYSSEALDMPLEMMKTSVGYVEGIKGWYVYTPEDPDDPTKDYNPYNSTADYNGFEDALKAAYDDWNSNTPVGSNIYLGAIYDNPSAPTTYTVTYNQNLPSGYSLSDGKTWYSVATTSDLSGDPIELEGSADMTCEDTSGNTRTLLGWNTVAELTGDKYNFGDKFSDASVFTSNPLTLYAIWSDPVAPGPAGPYMYWIVDGDGDNKTIHYYASATDGDGRTAVDFDENGVVYTSLSEDERNSIKKAVFEKPIVATDVRRLFKDFKGLDSITDLGNLDTSNATSFKSMFEHCEAIKKIETSGLETNSLTDTSYMFTYCSSATSIILGDNFDTSNVTSMREMFNTTGAVELDLTNFDTSNVTDMYGMFATCQSLKVIRVSDKFVVDKVNSSRTMFVNCENLVGEQGTKYTDTATPWDRTYAHIDEGPTNPGFFSGASTPPTPTPTPSPSPSYGGNTGGSDSDGSSSGGPINVTNNNLNNFSINNIPQSLLLNDPALYLQLMSYPENAYMQKTNAKDYYGNTGFGRWLRIPNTTTWYFYAGDFNNNTNNSGFLKDGWFNLGWDGVDRWYRFDSNGVMQLGWYEENGKIYFLQNDLNDNWYGKALTGTHVIDGVTYTFDSTGALIQ